MSSDPGNSKDHIDEIFNPFPQTSSSSSQSIHGGNRNNNMSQSSREYMLGDSSSLEPSQRHFEPPTSRIPKPISVSIIRTRRQAIREQELAQSAHSSLDKETQGSSKSQENMSHTSRSTTSGIHMNKLSMSPPDELRNQTSRMQHPFGRTPSDKMRSEYMHKSVTGEQHSMSSSHRYPEMRYQPQQSYHHYMPPPSSARIGMHYGYDQSSVQPHMSIAAELDLAAKENDDNNFEVNIGSEFPEPPKNINLITPQSSKKPVGSGKSTRQTPSGDPKRKDTETSLLTDTDEILRNSASTHRRRTDAHNFSPQPYRPSSKSHYYGSEQGYNPQDMSSGSASGYMHHPGYSYSTPMSGPHASQGYYPHPEYASPYHQGQSFSGQSAGDQRYSKQSQSPFIPPYGSQSHMGSYSPYPHFNAQRSHRRTSSWSPEDTKIRREYPPSNADTTGLHGTSTGKNSTELASESSSGQEESSTKKHRLDKDTAESGSPPRKRKALERSEWNDKVVNDPGVPRDTNTPEKQEKNPELSKGDQIESDIPSPFRSPLPKEKQTTPSSKKLKNSPIFASSPTGGYYNFPSMSIDTPGGHLDTHLNFSPMGSSLHNTFLMDDTPSKEQHTENSSSTFKSQSGGGVDTPTNKRYSSSRDAPVSPFTEFFGQSLTPLNHASMGIQNSPMERAENINRDFVPPSSSGSRLAHQAHIFSPPPTSTSSSRSDLGNHPMGFHGERGEMHSVYRGSPLGSRSPLDGPYDSGIDRYPPHGHSGSSMRVQLGVAESKKGFEGINKAIKAPPGIQRRGQHPSPPPPVFPFGFNRGSGIQEHRRPVMPSEHEQDIYGTPLSNISNRPSRGTPGPVMSSGGPHYTGYHQSPRYLHYPMSTGIPSATPIKNPPPVDKENSKSSRKSSCNCKRSRCLKLYCECFAAEKYCNGCNCQDCKNTPQFESIRAEAIKATRAKNPHAFKPRFATKILGSPDGTGHNMGCRCKRSACLKKYCECFEAGVVCGEKCKCQNCQNFIGSQALIDRRRKIKDHRGAESAMRSSDHAWKKGRGEKKNDQSRMPFTNNRSNMGMSPSPQNPSPQHHLGPNHPGNPSKNFFPPHMEPPRHAYPQSSPFPMNKYSGVPLAHHSEGGKNMAKSPSAIPSMRPQTRRRRNFNGPSFRGGDNGPPLEMFGSNNPKQTKMSALHVFSYLSNEDLFNASLVSRLWNDISLDKELWQY